ncbi:MAG TPA: ATP-binding protein [Verrucomicrobiae bacterium]|jgi:signal transduction histidine kinase
MHCRRKSIAGFLTSFSPEAAIAAPPGVFFAQIGNATQPKAPSSNALYWICGIAGVVIIALLWRVVRQWRQRTLRQRDDEIMRLVNEWTRSLQQEVAERKEAQRKLQESQELLLRQERVAAVGQLAAGLAHEFNNILTIVQGHVSLLMDNPNLDSESFKSLNHINDGVERTAKLIKQMLAFSRKQVIKLKPLGVKETLGQTAEPLQQILGERGSLQFDVDAGLPAIMADPEMFEQIIINLVVNARDAMSSGGQLTIRASEATFPPDGQSAKSKRKPGRFVRLSVTDTGSGMDTAIINHLFEPFFTTKDVGKGSGLGLATVHGMVEQHQGWIEVDSKIGKGTTFDIYFPVADQAPEKAPVLAQQPKARGGKETILIAEDKKELRELVREILEGHGYHVLEAENGHQALDLWDHSAAKIDLLLTDLAMPHGITGRDLASRVWERNPRLPVIFSSGYNQEMVQRTEENGRSLTFLSKPYRPAELVRAVREALDTALASSKQ